MRTRRYKNQQRKANGMRLLVFGNSAHRGCPSRPSPPPLPPRARPQRRPGCDPGKYFRYHHVSRYDPLPLASLRLALPGIVMPAGRLTLPKHEVIHRPRSHVHLGELTVCGSAEGAAGITRGRPRHRTRSRSDHSSIVAMVRASPVTPHASVRGYLPSAGFLRHGILLHTYRVVLAAFRSQANVKKD